MKNKILKLATLFITLFLGITIGIFLIKNKKTSSAIKRIFTESYVKFDDTRNLKWSKDFKIVEIESTLDKSVQKSYFYNSKSTTPRPLIVSLHTWSGTYEQNDELAELCRQEDLNYIHPNFRGANVNTDACCSPLALTDIDDAITYAIKNFNVDQSKIYVIGVSGGGYATISTFMKSRHKIKKFSAWASITDLEAWQHQSKIRKSNYQQDILDCTDNLRIAKQRSPLYWETPVNKLESSKLFIYAGIYDGIQGSVPISHSINFYNKILSDMKVSSPLKYVSATEKLSLFENQRPIRKFPSIAGRKTFLQKSYENVSLTIFEGNHEMLTKYALNELLSD